MRKIFIISLFFISNICYSQKDVIVKFDGKIVKYNGKIVMTKQFNPLAQQLFNRMDEHPSRVEKSIYSEAFDSLQFYNIDDSLSFIHAYGVHSNQAANLNWLSTEYTTINNGASWNSYFGYEGDGTASFLNTQFNPNLDGKYKSTSACLGVSIDSLGDINNYHGVTDGALNLFVIPNLAGTAYSRVNSATNTTTPNINMNEVFIANRISISTQDLYISKDKYSSSVASGSPPNLNVYSLARNSNGTPTDYSANNINFDFAGAGLSQLQVEKLVEIINRFNEKIRTQAPVVWGISPSYDAEINTLNFQANLNGGNVVKAVNKSGVYLLNNTIIIEDNTTLNIADNVVFKKNADYLNMFINKGGLTKTLNENITINGLTISVNGKETGAYLIPGMRGQLGWFHVKNLTIKDFYCDDIGTFQYCIQFGAWENVHLENIYIEGNKDGLDFFAGHGAVIKNYTAKTYDDGVFLGGVGYPISQLEVMGDVYDIEFINYNYIDSLKVLSARGILFYLGSWADWTSDSAYQQGDFCVNSNNIYQVNNYNGFSAIGSTPPVHTSGTVTGADGISWHHIDTGSIYKTEIYNVSVDSSYFYDPYCAMCWFTADDIYTRTVYPGTEGTAKSWNIELSNSMAEQSPVVNHQNGLVDITLENNIFDSLPYYIISASSYNDGDSLWIKSDGNLFTNLDNYFLRTNYKKLFYESRADTFNNSTFTNWPIATGDIRAINYYLPFSSKLDITPVTSDTCNFNDGLHYWNGSSWILIP